MKKVLEDIKRRDFSFFERLTEEQKKIAVTEWTDEMKMAYLTRHKPIYQEDFFSQLDKIAYGTYKV